MNLKQKFYDLMEKFFAERVVEKARRPTKIQSLLFDKRQFDKDQAVSWAKAHGYRTGIEESGRALVMKQADPKKYDKMRTIELTTGVKAVVGQAIPVSKARSGDQRALRGSRGVVGKSQPGSSSVHVPATGEEDRITIKTKSGTEIQIAGKAALQDQEPLEHDLENLEDLRESFNRFLDEEETEKGGPGSGSSGGGGKPHPVILRPDKGFGKIIGIQKDLSDHFDQLQTPLDNIETEVLKEWITINGAHIDPEHEKGATHAVPGHGKGGHGGHGEHAGGHGEHAGGHGEHAGGHVRGHGAHGHHGHHGEAFNPLEAATEAAAESTGKSKTFKAADLLGDQDVLEGMDWELAHGVNDEDVARETAIMVLGKDPNHYRKLLNRENGTDDVLQKDTSETETDPFAGAGYNIDIGSGQSREPGYLGLDLYPYDHGTIVHDVHQGLPFDDGTVQNVRMVNSLHTMDELENDPTPLISEIHRVLAPGGSFTYEGPEDIFDSSWANDFPGLVQINHEDNVQKSADEDETVHRMEFTRVATPDPATANDAYPRMGQSEVPLDEMMAATAMTYWSSDQSSSGPGNRAHGYPSQGSLANKESEQTEVELPHEKDVREAFHPLPVNPPPPKRSTRKSRVYQILKAANAPMKQLIYCVVLAPGEVDTQDEWMRAEEIEKAAHSYLTKSRVVGEQHSKVADCEVVESYIAPQDMEFNGQYGPQTVTKGSWVIGIKVNDPDLWQKVLDGEITGVSVGGLGVKDGEAEAS
jgi:SAM-dependent methyltransferase